ncbi:TIGR02281 family clan AA aspartic protease [Ruegeria pomeroyi]|uniref:TIGR02281 family clan AA aspartic protease n=1 Tax=Ruegeria pomeroyi TaxID=89184 RepID=A0A9Q3WNE0_9RHOB|nr:TIGR02281 family clan AA aspartic protease [Ruegeria pomeroyi]MCE8539435.1 TIGR02281 family clan AA aspartic protease [Ruegeria pomeroyi]MCE8555034.1 TIGR02281 family clan AA aspartic protease [Ruegeria pomeroyi]
MVADDFARLIYLMLLVAALLFWFISQRRASLGKAMQMAMAWVFIFVGVIAMVGLWDDIRGTVAGTPRISVSDNRVEIPRSPDGHYYATLIVEDKPLRFLVDTGASQVVLSHADAERLGIDTSALNYFGRAYTANGEVRTAPVKLGQVQLGGFTDQGVTAWVNEGDMAESLLGMDYLQRFSSIQIAGGTLVLSR